ncbi:ATP-binding protein [Noviherbaspirillum galbum]|uniref:histidine kinase n=1 Tax=Noviherbaspirillum galbum TaxID=2709383 RepID=A0A6B3SPZ3_9BURK|nr:ATP-binding protein [Noviherbaspirillum galbum]NEX62578.1 GAF domain-containing protein [Noviherbaspirillum galbum]
METSQDISSLLQACEKEPIHIPGAIQPFGVLVTVDGPQLIIRNASVNCPDAFGLGPDALLGRSLAELVDGSQLQELDRYLRQDNLREQAPFGIRLLGDGGTSARWELSAHEYQGCLIVELEPGRENAGDTFSFHHRIRDAVQCLQTSGTLQQLCEIAVQQVQAITGFDRVMLYQFTEEWHGRVIAEARLPHMTSFLGHHFPASDIPPQARAVFLQNWVRMIPDVNYVPAAIEPGTNPRSGAPLDLGHAMLRSVSPIHLEYLRNMEVRASLTISLVDSGKLWGLIACHHASPRLVDTDSRLGARMVGQLVSAQLHLKESLENMHYRARLREVQQRLLAFMEQESDLAQGMMKHSPTLLDLAAAQGAAAAIQGDVKWTAIGKTPSPEQIAELVDWLASEQAGQPMYCTDRLSVHFPPAHAYKDIASGLLAVSIPKSERHYILWFRPEAADTITWAGNPEKAVIIDGGQPRLHPRKSFHSWRETVSGVAMPWKKVETEVIAEFRNSILAIGLQREFRKEQDARARAERVSREKENMVNVVSHDLRTPLAVVRMSSEMLQHGDVSNAQMLDAIVHRGLRASTAIEQLANNVLDMAKMDAGTLSVAQKPEDPQALVQEAVDLALPIAEKKGVLLQAGLHAPGERVCCDRARITQVFNNLIGNALKFTAAGGRIMVSARPDGDMLVFCVADTGIGIAADQLPRIFDRFYQEKHAQQQGAGLGLAIVKTIIAIHGGQLWVESVQGEGSRFYFSLPRKKP